ncbi:MAG: hypothetical protein WCK28_17020 [Burkholderiales bacterium]
MPPSIRFSAADEAHLQLVPHVSLDLFRRGVADDDAWATLTTRVNWGTVLAHRFHGEAVGAMETAARALAAIHARRARLGRWGASGPELTALQVALVMVDEMQQAHTRRELHDALQVVKKIERDPARVGELIEVTEA